MTTWPKVSLKLTESAKASAGVDRGPRWLAGPACACPGSSCLLEKLWIFDAILTRLFWWRFRHHFENHVSMSSTVAYANAASWMRCFRHRLLPSNWSWLRKAGQTHLCVPFLHLSSSCHFLGWFDDFENFIKTSKSRSKIAHSARNTFAFKAELKVWSKHNCREWLEAALGCLAMTDIDGVHVLLCCQVDHRRFRILYFLISKIYSCSFQDLWLKFLRQHEPTQNSAKTTPRLSAAAI